MDVSKNRGGPPKSSILIGFSIINHPFWGVPLFLETPAWFLRNFHYQMYNAHSSYEGAPHGSGDLHRQLPPGKRPQSRLKKLDSHGPGNTKCWTDVYRLVGFGADHYHLHIPSFYSHFLRETGDCLPLDSSSEKLQNAIGKACRSMQRNAKVNVRPPAVCSFATLIWILWQWDQKWFVHIAKRQEHRRRLETVGALW